MWVTSHCPKIGKFTISKQSHKNVRIIVIDKSIFFSNSLRVYPHTFATVVELNIVGIFLRWMD